MRVAAFWFPAQERGIAAGVFNLGASFGAILAPPLIAWSILHYDWHAAFLIVSGLALAWAILWLLLYRNPNRHRALSKEEAAFIAAGQEPMLRVHDEEKPLLREILKERNFWGIALPRFFAGPVWGTLGY